LRRGATPKTYRVKTVTSADPFLLAHMCAKLTSSDPVTTGFMAW
ncbi:unnamed protein product, partial [marine sediment metagenome]